MKTYLSAKQKYRNLRRTIRRTLAGEFPFENARAALTKLHDSLLVYEELLDAANEINDQDGIRSQSQIVQVISSSYLPIIGLLLRSSNVRNAFELMDPLAQIASAVLPDRSEIIISSEWELIPFARPMQLPGLNEYVFVGLPATEAASALILPVTAHELAHPVWRRLMVDNLVHPHIQADCQKQFTQRKTAYKATDTLFNGTDVDRLPDAIAQSVTIAMNLAEELFCDLFAHGIFGESFIYSFTYLIAPGVPHVEYDAVHPRYYDRWAALKKAAESDGDTIPSFEELGLIKQKTRGTPRQLFIRDVAEIATNSVVDLIWDTAKEIILKSGIKRPDRRRAQLHLREFENNLPSIDPRCLGDITNAGWMHHLKLHAEKSLSDDEFARSSDLLNELMLKSIEVLEISRKVERGP